MVVLIMDLNGGSASAGPVLLATGGAPSISCSAAKAGVVMTQMFLHKPDAVSATLTCCCHTASVGICKHRITECADDAGQPTEVGPIS